MTNRTSHAMPRGLTLLEIVLTLSLAVVLMGLIGGAMRSYVREMNVRDLEIRRTHLATQLISMIETDLRAALHPEPIDTASLESFLANATNSGDGNSGDDSGLSSAGLGDGEGGDDESLDVMEDLGAESLTTTGVVLETPGLIGDQFAIQFDISRLPRLEEYSPLVDDGSGRLQDIPSDLKTVSYYVQAPGTIGGVQDDFSQMATNLGLIEVAFDGGGLIRRSLDRALTIESAQTSGLSQLQLSGRMVAPEVVEISFQYWDGLVWLPNWDSDLMEELPLAVEIQLSLRSTTDGDSQPADGGLSLTETYRHIVRLPMANPISEEEEVLDTETETSASSDMTGVGP